MKMDGFFIAQKMTRTSYCILKGYGRDLGTHLNNLNKRLRL
jgi:hypothetical protein